jgi:RNA polymerase sigma factor (sigma-70 family)
MSDLELLEQYARQGRREALEELIRRHARWVHGVAVRRVGDEHLAQDVTQAVFLVLAQKPPRITSESGLPGWLFGVTCNASHQALRSESRLKRREKVFAMEHQEARASQEISKQEWEEMAPHLDLAVQALSDEDRSAVLLRFYQQKSHADVAAALGVSEEAARKRVSRAVTKLREALLRRGVAAPAMAGLVVMLESSVVPPVSAAVMESALAVAAGAGAAQAGIIAKGVIVMLTWTKTKVAAVACAALLVLGGGAGVVVLRVRAQHPPPPVTEVPTPPRGNLFVADAAPQPAADPDWRARFDQVYRLGDGEALKRIPPPFIPERMDWYRTTNRGQADAIPRGPDYMTFHWDGKLSGWGMGFGYRDGQSVAQLLGSTLRMKTYEFDGPPALLSHKLAGDFIIRRDATPQAQLDALCLIVRADGGPAMRFTQRTLDRPGIVVGGQYEFRPLKDSDDARSVHLYVGEPDRTTGGGGGSGDLDEFVKEVGSRCGVPVFSEVTGAKPDMVRYRYHRSSNLSDEPPGPQRDQRVRKLLDVVSAQTGLQFKIETRPVEVWVAEGTDPRHGL